jgi:hypothetical protein
MVTAIKERMTTNLQKVKSEGGTRVARIREILQTAMSEAVSEVKAGSGEMGQIAKETIADAKETEEFTKLKDQYTDVQSRLVGLDETLVARYGDRYQTVKQQVAKYWTVAKAWYNKTKAEVKVGAPDPVQRMQIAIGAKMAQAGTATAQQEQTIKQHIEATFRPSDSQ